MGTCALIVDVDGVVSPVKGRTAWGDDVDGNSVPGYLPVSPTLNARLDELAHRPDVVAAWLTSWDPSLRAGSQFPGRDWPTVAALLESPLYDEAAAKKQAGERWQDNHWWKWWALSSWLDRHPEVDKVVWCDDHLNGAFFRWDDDYGIRVEGALSQGMVAGVDLERRGIRSLLISPQTHVGLTPDHLDRIAAFVDEPAMDVPVPLPDNETPGIRELDYALEDPAFRTCGDCSPGLWYLRYMPRAIACRACRRVVYRGHEVADIVRTAASDEPNIMGQNRSDAVIARISSMSQQPDR